MIQIQVRVDRKGTNLPGIARQSAFATALAMNRTMEEGQERQRQGLYGGFRFRGTDTFFNRMVKIRGEDRARKDRLRARIRIEGPEGDESKGALLARHEKGGLRTTGRGGASTDINFRLKGMFYLPTRNLRPSFANAVPRSMHPANLRLTERRDVDGGTMAPKIHRTWRGKQQLKGKQRTFVLFSNTGQPWGIYQRTGSTAVTYARNRRGIMVRRDRGRDPSIKKLWSFTPSISLKPRLRFEQRITRTIHERFQLNYSAFLSHAIRTSR